jgi:hypothetical protein
MRICLLIPDGVGIRNYLYSDLIKVLQSQGHEVVLWHSLDKVLIQLAEQRLGISLAQFPFEHIPDSVGPQIIREASKFARLRLNAAQKNNPTILSNWSKTSSSQKGKWLIKVAELLGSTLKSYKAVAIAETFGFWLIRKSPEFKAAKKLLLEIKPDLLFCTHQRVFSVTASIEAAKSMGIHTSTAIFSWDNLPKGRLPFRVDQYLVWSHHMRSELHDYYPEIADETIQITGTPQFDFYFKDDLLIDREGFAEKFGLDLSKEWVCFSGCDSLTSPNDPKYLKDVANSFKNEKDIQLIFRPVPVENTSRFQSVLQEFPMIKLLEPIWVKGNHWGNFFPLFDDIQLLINLAFHCKVVINMGSTMALDFATYGNVGLYLKYDHSSENTDWSVNKIYQFQHFKSMGNWNAVGYINSPNEILTLVREAMNNPDKVAPDRKLWFDKIVEHSLERSSAERVADAFLSLITLKK